MGRKVEGVADLAPAENGQVLSFDAEKRLAEVGESAEWCHRKLRF
jgi:hypothetical protein